jgi:hypothetical protein
LCVHNLIKKKKARVEDKLRAMSKKYRKNCKTKGSKVKNQLPRPFNRKNNLKKRSNVSIKSQTTLIISTNYDERVVSHHIYYKAMILVKKTNKIKYVLMEKGDKLQQYDDTTWYNIVLSYTS